MKRITLAILLSSLALVGCGKAKTYDGICAVPGALGGQFELSKRPVVNNRYGTLLEIEADDGRHIYTSANNCVIIESVKAGS